MEKLYSMPLFLTIRKVKGKWKKDHLNFNNYHNWFPHLRNRLKKEYQSTVATQFNSERFQYVEITFTLIPPDKRRRDRSNVLSLHEKFFCDALTQNNILKDDNDCFIKRTIYETGPIDKGKGRVEILVREL